MAGINAGFNLDKIEVTHCRLSINIPNWDWPLTELEPDLYPVCISSSSQSSHFTKLHQNSFIFPLHTPTPAPFQITKWYLDNYYHNKSSVILTSCNYFRFIKAPPNQLSAFHKFSKDFIPFSPRNIFSWCVSVVCY